MSKQVLVKYLGKLIKQINSCIKITDYHTRIESADYKRLTRKASNVAKIIEGIESGRTDMYRYVQGLDWKFRKIIRDIMYK